MPHCAASAAPVVGKNKFHSCISGGHDRSSNERHFLELSTVQREERKEKAETIKRILVVKHVLMWQPIPEYVIAMHVYRNT